MADIDYKTMTLSAVMAVLIAGGIAFTPDMFNKSQPQYFCEARPELGLVSCDSFSKYIDPMGKCIRDTDTNLICKEGWNLVEDDILLPEEDAPASMDVVSREGSYVCKRPLEGGCEI